jgi:MFS family permease
VSAALGRTFASLAVPNYRRYFSGQVVSITGNWMQMVAEMWLVVELTGSGVSVGLTAALQFLPLLLFAAWGGLLADRLNKRRLLMVTQSLMTVPALTLWALTMSGNVELWMVYALVLTRGALTAVDNPARQSFVVEMVGGDRVVNAVALNSVVVHTARVLGPAAAGAVIALFGVGTCFLLNALSFAAMLTALKSMDSGHLHVTPLAVRSRGQLRSALAHVTATPALWIPLAMMAVVGTLAYNFQVLFPLLASFTWHGTAATYAGLTAAMGIGSVTGALITGTHGRVSPRLLVLSATGFGVFLLLAAAAPTIWLQLAALVPLGAVSVSFSAGVQSAMQLAVDPAMRGRVMALYSMVFLGSTPVGAPLVGWVAQVVGPRAGLVLGGAAALVAAVGARAAYTRLGARPARERRRCESSSRTRTAPRPLLHETRP